MPGAVHSHLECSLMRFCCCLSVEFVNDVVWVCLIYKLNGVCVIFSLDMLFVFDCFKCESICSCVLFVCFVSARNQFQHFLVSHFLYWIHWFGFVICFKQAVWKPLVNVLAKCSKGTEILSRVVDMQLNARHVRRRKWLQHLIGFQVQFIVSWSFHCCVFGVVFLRQC